MIIINNYFIVSCCSNLLLEQFFNINVSKVMGKLSFLLLFFLLQQVTISAQVAIDANNNYLIKGSVKDKNNKPVAFASIKIKNENRGITTDSVGNFSIKTSLNTSLVVSSIGFDTSIVSIKNDKELVIILSKNNKSLSMVTIASKTETGVAKQPEKAQSQNIANTLNDFTTGSNITTEPSVFNHLENASSGRPKNVTQFLNNTGSGRIYTGAALPVFAPKNETKGRQYLFDHWVTGAVVNVEGVLINNDKYLFNLDKISNSLLFTQDKQSAFELDIKEIKEFALTGNDEELVFKKIIIDEKPTFLLLLSINSTRYQLYKKIKTKLVKADYINTGLTESGNNFDEFVDDYTYFINNIAEKKLETFELKKKSLLKVLSADNIKVNEFFNAHKSELIDENFVKKLLESLTVK